MRSPLELLEGGYEHALLTTYSFNLRFFEEAVLRAPWAAEVRSVVVFVDAIQLGEALGDRAPSAAGRAYHVVAARRAAATFHPKLILLTGREGARLCVSSANLTADGLMRNAESLIAFDSHLKGHTAPILQAGELFRRLSEDIPAHSAAAILAALSRLPEAVDEPSPFTLLHNLDRKLIDAFPIGDALTAIAPFVDAKGEAAAPVSARARLTVIVDGDQIAASPGFFAGPWTVDARRFEARLHGKAYQLTTAGGRWTLIGSPNLSTPALLRTASDGNLEVAVAVSDSQALALPVSHPWDGEELETAAQTRLTHEPAPQPQAAQSGWAFNAWEDELRIRVDGIPDGTHLQRWAAERWVPFGDVADGAVLVTDPEIRPTRLRALLPGDRIAFAVVARPAQLRARQRAQTGGRQSEAAGELPLDVETVRVLEDVLSELYALSEIAEESTLTRALAGASDGKQEPGRDDGLIEWMPRSPEEEPRIPPLYLDAWRGEPDALLALIGRVLRIDAAPAPSEHELALENIDLSELDVISSEEQIDSSPPSTEPPAAPAERGQLERYRRAFVNRLGRGEDFVRATGNPTLATWAFTYLMHLLEDLSVHHVDVDGKTEPLMPHTQMSAIRLALLEGYLGRAESDLVARATAQVHLAAAVRERQRYSVRDRERLDALGYRWAAELIAVPREVPRPDQAKLGLGVADAELWLEDYADRSQWQSITEHAETVLDPVWLELTPYPTVVGRAAFATRLASPAWALLAFGAPASYAALSPLAVVVRNAGQGPVSIHALINDPTRGMLVEAYQRRSDDKWTIFRYQAASRVAIERMSGPGALERVGRTEEGQWQPEEEGFEFLGQEFVYITRFDRQGLGTIIGIRELPTGLLDKRREESLAVRSRVTFSGAVDGLRHHVDELFEELARHEQLMLVEAARRAERELFERWAGVLDAKSDLEGEREDPLNYQSVRLDRNQATFSVLRTVDDSLLDQTRRIVLQEGGAIVGTIIEATGSSVVMHIEQGETRALPSTGKLLHDRSLSRRAIEQQRRALRGAPACSVGEVRAVAG
jgi:hypothetical protein